MDSKHQLCSLGERDFQGREKDWHAVLNRTALGCIEHDDGYELTLSNDGGTRDEILRLASLEDSCCGWMKIRLVETDVLTLTISADVADGKDVIGLLIPEQVKQMRATVR